MNIKSIIGCGRSIVPLSRFGKRHERTFGKPKQEWDGDFRKPPKPESYWTKTKGQCRWCGFMINNDKGGINERRSWHEERFET